MQIDVGELENHDLLARLKRCVAEDREVTARLLEHFAEVDARGLYRDQGFSSMFEYAVQGLYMSEAEAGLRITVGRLVRQFPLALEMLGRGEIHLTALRLLAPRLTAENLDLLRQARFKSKQEVLALIARHFPQPDVSDSIRRLPVPRSAAPVMQPSLLLAASAASAPASSVAGQGLRDECRGSSALPGPATSSADVPVQQMVATMQRNDECRGSSALPGLVTLSPAVPAQLMVATLQPNDACSGSSAPSGFAASSPAASAQKQDVSHGRRAPAPAACVPLSEGRFKVQFTVGQRLHDKLKQAQELMRHRAANGDLAVVLERAVDLLIAERKKQLFARAAKPRPARRRNAAVKAARASRYVPRAIRREVVERAQEQCTFVAPDGRRCAARGQLELDHRVPHARGGPTTAENLRVLCRSHNLLMAERIYGREFMRERMERAQQTRAASPPIALDNTPRLDAI